MDDKNLQRTTDGKPDGYRSKTKLTDWEVGQDLVAISDYISERVSNVMEAKPAIGEMLQHCRRRIGDAFSALKSHGFGIYESEHPDDIAVDNFAAVMREKMKFSRAKGRAHWEDPSKCTPEFLSHLLREHLEKGDPVDVANFCMMLWNRGHMIAPGHQMDHVPAGVAAALEDLIKKSERMVYGAHPGIEKMYLPGQLQAFVRSVARAKALFTPRNWDRPG